MNKIESKETSFLFWGYEVLNSLCDGFSEHIVIPLLKSGYHVGGEVTARVAGCFSTRMEKHVRNFWVDPFSTETLLTLLKPVENLSHKIARRKPTQKPFLHFLDQSLVSSSQHLYAYIKEVNHLLQIPQNIKAFIKTFSFDNFMTHSTQLGGRMFIFLNSIFLGAKQVALILIDYAIRITDLFFQCILATSKFEVLGYLREIVHDARMKVRNKFKDLAMNAIQKRECRIRREIVANVADFTTRYVVSLVNRVVIKTGLGLAAYSCFEKALQSSIPVHTLALQTLAGVSTVYLLWKNIYEPYLDEYYQAYKKEFDPSQCTMKEFLDRYYLGYLYFPLEGVSNFFQMAE